MVVMFHSGLVPGQPAHFGVFGLFGLLVLFYDKNG
jgi:hypothetical protein